MGKKILLADDSITIQKVIELTFSDEDFDVVTVGNGRLAIEKVQEVRPDVVLCDVIMPEKDGYEVCDFIKRSPQLGATPVLLLTGAFEPFDQERAARVGCDGFLAKPFEPETLIAKVKELLSKAASRHAPAVAPVHEHAPSPVMAPPPPAPAPASATPFTVSPVPVVAPAPPPFQSAPSQATFVPEPPPTVVDEPEMAFIPDEPFEDLDTPSFDAPAPAAPEPVSFAPAPDPVDELLPMTAEESESLSVSGDDASATVMFRADSLPWSSPAPPPPPVQAQGVDEPHEITSDLPGFEEIIEETVVETEASSVLMSPPPVFVPEAPPMPEPVPMPVAAPPAPVVPPPAPMPTPPPPVVVAPPPAPPVVVAPPAPPLVVPPVVVAAPPPPPPVVASVPPPPPPYVAPPPVLVSPPPVLVSPPVIAAAPPVFTPTPEPVVAPPPPPPPPPVVEASSFADVAAEILEPDAPSTPSVAAQVDVPVDMVAQIAQRVVAQVSEKVVERIAWEVIPELAEALIKREIERLKAELQQLS